MAAIFAAAVASARTAAVRLGEAEIISVVDKKIEEFVNKGVKYKNEYLADFLKVPSRGYLHHEELTFKDYSHVKKVVVKKHKLIGVPRHRHQSTNHLMRLWPKHKKHKHKKMAKKRGRSNGAAASSGGAPSTKRFKKGRDRTAGRYTGPGARGGDLKNLDLSSNNSVHLAGNVGRISFGLGTDIVGLIPSLVARITKTDNPIGGRAKQKIMVRSLQLAGVVRTTANSDDLGQVTIHLVLDKQSNGVDAGFEDVFDLNNAAMQSGVHLRNLENSQRFTVYKTWHINIQQLVSSKARGTFLNHYHKADIPIEYAQEGTGGTAASLRSNNLFMLISGNIDSHVELRARLRYSDN